MMLPRNKNLRPQRLSLSPNTASEGLSTTDPYQYLWKAQEIKIIKKRRKALDNTGNNFTDITLFFQAQPLLFLKLTLLPKPCSPIISFLFHVFLCFFFWPSLIESLIHEEFRFVYDYYFPILRKFSISTTACLPACLSTRFSTYLSTRFSTCLSICFNTCLSVFSLDFSFSLRMYSKKCVV